MNREFRNTCHPLSAGRLERRAGGGETIAGYASVFYDGVPGTEYQVFPDMVERILPGAFYRAIRERQDVRALLNHDASYLLGRTAAGTLRLSADRRGLRYSIDPPDTQAGRHTIELVRRRDIDCSSFSFTVDQERFDELGGILIREFISFGQLFDVGPVTFPAYPATTAEIETDTLQKLRAECIRLLRERSRLAAGNVTTRPQRRHKATRRKLRGQVFHNSDREIIGMASGKSASEKTAKHTAKTAETNQQLVMEVQKLNRTVARQQRPQVARLS